MCACCHSSCYGCCFPPRCRDTKLIVISKHRICTPKKKEKCNCHRHRCLLVALAYLFRCSHVSMLSMLWRMACNAGQPLRGFSRDAAWSVMQGVRAPFTEVNDQEIYDSFYDRCGMTIDPFDPDNTYKLLRLMFINTALGPDQRMGLMRMLEKLNECSFRQVNLDLLLQTLASISIDEFVYSLIHQHKLNAGNAKLSKDLSQLYERVGTTNKNAIIRNRNRRDRGKVDVAMGVDPVKGASDMSRNTIVYCIPGSRDTSAEQSPSNPSGCLRYAPRGKDKRRKNNSNGRMLSGRTGTDP
ncbi:uncharacterized protein LOC6596332 [Drosophila persimilis]|uniref:uncharacterized protein LOC6596332 n=1 Tax=Drosophila persimilis TaxID=7234 RepID=UPI000F0931FF|nr:uncharacterized protein LOC6596332 [Drosophila persimilis]